MKYITLKSGREPLSQTNKQGSILYMYMTHTCLFLYAQKNIKNTKNVVKC